MASTRVSVAGKSRGLRRVAATCVAAVALLASSAVLAPDVVSAAGPVYPVMNTSETPPDGVWFRNSPRTADTNRVTGLGVYINERVELLCFDWGDAVGPYGTRLWYKVNNVTRPTVNGGPNAGYLNDHYINDGMVANQVLPGMTQCGTTTPPPTPTVTLAQGPTAPFGFRYAITLSGFSPNAAVSVLCYDTVSPNGFGLSFTMTTDGNGNASTANQCYSGDGPDHWVIAGGIASNHVTWGGSTGGGGTGGTGGGGGIPGGGTGGTSGGTPGPKSVFYSPNNDKNTLGFFSTSIAEKDLAFDTWKSPTPDCFGGPASAEANVPTGVSVLSGWSAGRLGPMYYLAAADPVRLSSVRTIVLFDPGSLRNMRDGCDSRFNPSVGSLIAKWLTSNPANRLIVFTGRDSEEHSNRIGNRIRPGWGGPSMYTGLWTYYFPDIWNTPAGRDQALVCDYNNMAHPDVLKNFASYARVPSFACPSAPKGYVLSQWHP